MPNQKKGRAGTAGHDAKPATTRQRKPKVFWSKPEQDALVDRAIDIRREDPELSGLPLLRKAQLVLPVDRRRTIRAKDRVEWFEPALKAEIKRRADAANKAQSIVIKAHEEDPYVPILKTSASELERQSKLADQWLSQTEHQGESILGMLGMIHSELKALNEKLGHSVPVLALFPPDKGNPETGTPRRN